MPTKLAEVQVAESPFTRYAAALLPLLAIIIGGLQSILDNPGNWVVAAQFGLLVVGTAVAYGVKLLPVAWQGVLKTGAQIITVGLTALIPFLLPGGFDPDVNTTAIFVAVLNAFMTEFGIRIRNDAKHVA